MPSFEYEPLVLSLKPKNLDEKKDKGDTNGADLPLQNVIDFIKSV